MDIDLTGKVVLITGGTSGIGQVAAEKLAAMGAQIILIARDHARGQAALQRLHESGAKVSHAVYYADLAEMSDVKCVSAEIAKAHPRVDVLINNAGAMFSGRSVTREGLERTFALNHMSYFVLTAALRDVLLSSAPARIINTASDAHAVSPLDFDDLQSNAAYRGNLQEWLRYGGPGFKVYGRSKLCNILFTRELARRLAGSGVTANCLHPGFVATRFGAESGGLMSFGLRFAKRFALSPQEGAKTLIYLASSPDVAAATGLYFDKCRPIQPSAVAQDDAAAQRLWQESAKLAGIAA
jgi:NAD(P)-dependent dehydrogenase (short-subunit alcohol dehydrogenase family)